MGMQDINQAAADMNAFEQRANAFADEAAGIVQDAVADAQTQLGQRQAAYDALAADLVALVSDRMEATIDYEPTEAAADLQPDGHFTTWEELITFANAMPPHSNIIVRLPDNTTLRNTSRFYEHLYGPRHWIFKSKTPTALGAHTPVFEIGIYDEATYNQYFDLALGNQGSFQAEYVKFRWQPVSNAALPYSSNVSLINAGADNFVDLRVCEITHNDGLAFVRASTGSIVKAALHTVTLDGNMEFLNRSGTSNIALLTTGAVTTLNGAVIYDASYTPGTNLITN